MCCTSCKNMDKCKKAGKCLNPKKKNGSKK